MRGKKRLSITAGGEARRIVRVTPDGRRRLMVEWYGPNGKARFKSCGDEGVAGDEARCAEFRAGLMARPAAQDWTVASWALDWLKVLKKRIGPKQGQIVEATWVSYAYTVQHCIVGSALGIMPIAKVESADIVRWAEDQMATMATKTLRLRVTVVNQCFKSAARQGIVPVNPSLGIMGLLGIVAQQVPVKNLLFEELASLIAKLEELEAGAWSRDARDHRHRRILNPRPSFFTRLAAGIGVRAGEGLGLMWSDFTEGYKRVHVRRQVPSDSTKLAPLKGKKNLERGIDVPAFLWAPLATERKRQHDEAIRESRVPSPWVLGCDPTTAARAKPRLRRAIRAAAAMADVPPPFDANLHTLRHTYGSGMADEGVDPRVIQRAMGHSDPITTAIYTRGRPRPAPEAAAKFNAAFRGAEAKTKRRRKQA